MTIEEAWSNCLLLLHVAPPLVFTVMSFLATPINSLTVPSPSLRVYQCNKQVFAWAIFYDCFYTIMFYFIWPNFLSVGIPDISFQSAGTGKYATPTRHLNFHFAPLVVSYTLLDNWISSWSNPTIHFSSHLKISPWVTFRKRAATYKRPLCSLCKSSIFWICIGSPESVHIREAPLKCSVEYLYHLFCFW